jgi:uncharacterized membrane protein YozB (DUF420 family)
MATVEQPKSTRYRHARTDALIGIAAVSSVVFIWLIAVPAFGPERLPRHLAHLPMLAVHVLGGATMLIMGAIALRIGLTRDWFRWHKPAGYTYLAAGTLASVSALIRSFDTAHTPGLATGALAVVWLAFSAMAFRAIRNRRIEQHRAWMIRSYVAAWTFVFCRFWTRVMPSEMQGGETDMIWVTWVMPLFLTEMLLQWKAGAKLKR